MVLVQGDVKLEGVTSFNPRGGGASATLAFESIVTPFSILAHYRLITDARTHFLL